MGFWDALSAAANNSGNGGGGYQGSGYQGGGQQQPAYSPSFDWRQFLDQRAQIQQANQQMNNGAWGQGQYDQGGNMQQNVWGNNNDNSWVQAGRREERNEEKRGSRSNFIDMFNGGTQQQYNGNWQQAGMLDNAAIEAAKGAEWWSNSIANLTGNQDLAFDASKFDISKGLNAENLSQIGKFGISLPGQAVGGILEGVADIYEGVSGRPINEYKEVKQANGSTKYEIPDYELDLSQRGADLLDSAINIGGLVFGGSGRAIAGAGKAVAAGAKTANAARFAKGAEAVGNSLEKMSTGVLERAWEATGHAKAGAVLQTGFDIAEEAGEEYIQSLADDVRNKTFDPDNSFDKASQSAVWGALGGGMMSLGGRGLNAISDKAFAKAASSNQPAPNQEQFTARIADFDKQAADPGSYTAPQIREYETKMFQNMSTEPGSGTVKCFMGKTDMMPDQGDLSDANIIAMYEAPGGAETILNDFAKIGVTRKQFEDAIYRRSVNGQVVGSEADALNALIAGKPSIELIYQRTPGTKNGRGRVELRQFYHGNGASLHPMSYGILGGDTDGDNMTVFFGADRYPQVEWFSSMLATPEGSSNASWWYSQISPTLSKTPGEIDRHLSMLKDYYETDSSGNKLTLFDKYSPRLKEAISGMTQLDGNDNAMSKLFMELGEDVQNAKDAGNYTTQQTPPGGRAVKNRIINSLSTSSIGALTKAIDNNNKIIDAKIKEAFVSCGIEEDPVNFLKSRGTLAGATRAADLWKHLGFVEATLIRKGNVPFRQYGQAGFTTKATESYMSGIDELQGMVSEKSIVTAFIRASFGMTASGVSPSTSIEGIIESFTVAKTLQECGMVVIDGKMHNAIKTQAQLDKFLETYVRIYNDYNEVYKEAKKQATGIGDEFPLDFVDRNDLSGKDDPMLIGNLVKTFGSTPLNFIFDLRNETESMRTMTFGEFVEMVGARNGAFQNYFMNNGHDNNFLDFITRIQKDYGVQRTRMSARVVNRFESKDIGDALDYFDAHRDFGPYANAVIEYANELASYLDPQIVLQMGILDPYTMARNTIGRELLGHDRKKALDTYLSGNLYQQFKPIMDMLSSNDIKERAAAEANLNIVKEVSILHERIADELIKDGSSGTLRFIMRTDITFDQKRSAIDTFFKQYNQDFDYVIDSMRTESSEFDLSSLSARIRQGESYSDKATKMLYSDARNQANSLEKMIIEDPSLSDGKASLLEGYIDQIAQVMPGEVDLDLIGTQVHESMIIAHKAIEKGTIEQIAGQIWDSLARIRNGGSSPYLVTTFGLRNGIVDMDMFQSNYKLIIRALTDPNFKIRCTDPITMRSTTITQEAIFKTIDPKFRSDRKPSAQQWVALFKRYPQVLDWMSRIQSNPAFTSNAEATTVAKGQNFIDGFKKYSAAHRDLTDEDSLAIYDAERGVQELSNLLLNDPQYKTYMVACLADDLENQSLTPAQITAKAKEFHRDAARRIYANMHASPGTTQYKETIERERGALFESNFSRFQSSAMLGLEIAQKSDISKISAIHLADFINMNSSTESFLPVYYQSMLEKIGKLGVDVEGGVSKTVAEFFGKSYEEIFSNINNIYAKRGEDVQRRMNNIGALFNYFAGQDRINVNRKYQVDKTVIDDIKKNLSADMDKLIDDAMASNPNIDVAQLKASIRKMIDDETDTIVSGYESRIRPTDDVSHLILSDDDFKSAEALGAKVWSLYQEIGGFSRTLDECIEEVTPFMDSAKSRDELRRLWLGYIIEHEIREINVATHGETNPYLVPFTQDIDEFYGSLYSDGPNSFRKQLQEKGLIYETSKDEVVKALGFSGPSPKLKTPNTTSRIAQIAATNMRIMDDAAGTAILVSINGAQMKQHFGYALLPAANHTSSKPLQIKVSELRKLAEYQPDMLRWKMITSGNWDPNNASSWQLDTIGSQLSQLADDQDVLYFDPIYNPHGLSNANTPSTPSPSGIGEWHRLSAILGKLDDTTMEAMVMKAKKVFASKSQIVDDFDQSWFTRNDETLNIGDGVDPVSTQIKMTEALISFRRAYARTIANEFKKGSALDSTQFDIEQATLLACNLTPGLRITLSDDTQVILDANTILHDEAEFAEAWNAITQNGQLQIIACDVFTVTPTEFSYKIQNAVMNEYHLTDDINQTDIASLAENAAENWSDYQLENLPINQVLDGIKPFGYHVRHGIRLSDSQTAPQTVLDEEFGGSFGVANRRDIKMQSRLRFLDINDKDKGLWTTAQKISEQMGIGGRVSGVVRSFVSEKNIDEFFESIDEKRFIDTTLRQIDRNDVNGWYIDEKGNRSAGIVLDPLQIADAMIWGQKTNNLVIIPSEVFKLSDYMDSDLALDFNDQITIDIGGRRYQCNVFDPNASAVYRGVSKDVSGSERLPRNPNDITLTFMDYDNFFRLTDAGIYATEEGAKIAIRRGSYAKFSAERLMPKDQGIKSIASKDKIRNNSAILACVDKQGNPIADDNVWQKAGFRFEEIPGDKNHLKRIVADYLYNLIDNNQSTVDDDGVMRTDVGSDQCVALLTNGTKFCPIVTPKNSASEYSYMDVQLVGDDLLIPWSGETTLGNAKDHFGNEYFSNMKMSIDGEAFKGIVSVLPPDIGGHIPQAPKLALKIGGKEYMVHFIAGGETESSRALGREKYFQHQNYFEAMHKMNGSLLLTIQENGQYDVSDVIKRNFTESEIQDIFDNSKDIWTKIKNQAVAIDEGGNVRRLVLSDNDQINDVISMVLSNCDKYNIPFISVFTSLVKTYDGKIKPEWSSVNYHLAFDGLDFNKTALFFSNMLSSKRPEDQGIRFCPEGNADPMFSTTGPTYNYLFDDKGYTSCILGMGKQSIGGFFPVRWGKHEIIGDESFLRTPTGEGKMPMQEFYRRAYDRGLIDSQYQRAMQYADFLTHNNEYMQELAISRAKERYMNPVKAREASDVVHGEIISKMVDNPAMTFVELKNYKSVAAMGKTLSYHRKVVDRRTGEEIDPMNAPELKTYIDWFRKTFGDNIAFDTIDQWCKGQDGYTYNAGVGEDKISVDDLKTSMRQVVQNFKTKGIPITVWPGGRSQGNRYALPCQINAQIDWAWEHGNEFLKSKHGTKEEYARKIAEETKQGLEAIKEINKKHISQRIRLSQYMQWYYREMGEPIPDGLYVYNNVYIMDIADMYEDYTSQLLGGKVLSQEMVEEMNRMAANERDKITNIRNKMENNDSRHKANVPITPGGVVSSRDYNDAWSAERVLNNLATVSQVEAVMHPFVSASNLLDRFIGQTAMDWGLRVGRKFNFGPYKANHWLDPKIVDQAVNDPTFIRLYIAYRKAGFTGEEMVFLSQANSVEDINAWLDRREKNQTVFQKAVDRIYGFSSGGNIFIKTQMKNFVNRFCQFAETEGQDFWFADAGGGMSLLEASIAGDGAGKWFADVLGANDAYTPSFTVAMKALNSAKQGDMAQRHVVSMMYAEVVRRMPISKFFVTTTISRFPQYALNVTHRMFSWIAPASSIYYVFTDVISKTGFGKDINLEQAQVHRSLQEAMIVDLLHLGRSLMCMVLIGCSGLMQPPDDEKKWQNIDDWTIGGFRIGSEWWMKDILGMALPVAAFARASMLGRPDMSILSHGLADVCFSNPIMRVNDAIGFILDPEGGLITDYENDVEKYKDAPQGSPGIWEWVNAQGKAVSLSWASQFITPSVLRDFYVNMQPYEASYNRVFKSSVTGVTSTDETKTEKTSYEDAMIRRVTRRNPTLAWLLEAIVNPETGYNWEDMPRTVYYDDAQIASSEVWSIKGMDDSQANQKLMEIIEVMQQYDDMDELRKTGFYLDTETKIALSSTVWDIYHGYDDWWNSINQTDQVNYYVLGNGSFDEGKKLYYQMKQDVQAQKQYWNNFYYDKIKNSYLSEPMQTYNRYNTTYATDADGEVYATGIRPAGVLPIKTAPGTLTDPDSTAGYENDWRSVSAVTGRPMTQRALVAKPSEVEEWPSIESWSDNKDGSAYSTRYRQQYGDAGSAYGSISTSGLSTTSGYPKSYGTSFYGGGGGGRGGYGGGGRGYAPNIYSPNVSLPKSNMSKIMSTDRLINPNEQYLRPDFETKGSREAYKRSDI